MSQFIKKLKQVSQITPQPMGFRAIQPGSDRQKFMLIASLVQPDIDGLTDQVAGADAGLLRISKLSSGAKALGKISRAAPDIPWGVWLEGIAREEVGQMAKAGFDCVVFPPASTSLATLKDNKAGKILEMEVSTGEDLLPAVNELPVDAVLIASKQEKDSLLTWQRLIFFQGWANLLTKPLLACISSNVSNEELLALWKAGIRGIVIRIGKDQPAGRLKELRQMIDKIAFPTLRKSKRLTPLLPYLSQEEHTTTDTDDEEDIE